MGNLMDAGQKLMLWQKKSRKNHITLFPGLWCLCAACVLLKVIRKQSKYFLVQSRDEDKVWQILWRTFLSSLLPILAGALLLRQYVRLLHKRKSTQRETSPVSEPPVQPKVSIHTKPMKETDAKDSSGALSTVEEYKVETVAKGVMTDFELESGTLIPSFPEDCNKAINTSHRPHSVERCLGSLLNYTFKRKVRRAQKTLEDVQCSINAERQIKIKEWRISLVKCRNKMSQLARNDEGKKILAGYVFSSRMVSQKEVENTALYVRSLKEKVNHQCQQNEKIQSNIQRPRPRHQY